MHYLQSKRDRIGHAITLATGTTASVTIAADRPEFGVLFDDTVWDESRPIAAGRLLQPTAEAEIAFVVAETWRAWAIRSLRRHGWLARRARSGLQCESATWCSREL